MAAYFRRIIQTGARPIAGPVRPNGQKPRLPLAISAEPIVQAPQPAPARGIPPEPAAARMEPQHRVEGAPARPMPPHGLPPEPSEPTATFVAPRSHRRQMMAREPSGLAPVLHPPRYATPQHRSPEPAEIAAEPAFHVPDLLKAPMAPPKDTAALAPDQPEAERAPATPVGADFGQLRDVIAWIEQAGSEAPPRPIAEASRPPHQIPPERFSTKSETPVRTLEPPSAGFDAAEARHGAKPEPGTPAAPDLRPVPLLPPMPERPLPAAAPRTQAGRSSLIVNHLNVRVINEERHPKSEKPAPKAAAAKTPPTADWGRFERLHLRLP